VRVLAQAPAYGFTVAQARALWLRLEEARTSPLTFIPDEHDVSHLPGWVRAPKQITDGHLGKLAHANGAVLATLDENISASYSDSQVVFALLDRISACRHNTPCGNVRQRSKSTLMRLTKTRAGRGDSCESQIDFGNVALAAANLEAQFAVF
jgi:hypothetical protein